MTILSVDQALTAAGTAGKAQYLPINKLVPTVGVANIPHFLWAGGGNPSAGGYGTLGKANGRVLTDATAGAISFANSAGGGSRLGLESFGMAPGASTCTGTIVLVDRIADVLLAHNETTGSITGVSATSRLDSGEGCQIVCYVQSALSAGSNVLTLSYTNQAGTAGRSCAITTTASAIVNRSVNGQMWQSLQAGDNGVRSIESVTLTSGTATGSVLVALVRPIAQIPIPTASVLVERDFVVEIPCLPKIWDDSCFDLILLPTGAAAANTNMIGSIRLLDG